MDNKINWLINVKFQLNNECNCKMAAKNWKSEEILSGNFGSQGKIKDKSGKFVKIFEK